MTPHTPFHRLQGALDPDAGARNRIRRDVLQRIHPPEPADLLGRLRTILTPAHTRHRHVRMQMLERLLPVSAPVRSGYRFPKWVAAAALVLIVARMSPLLFLAPQSSAQSSVLIVPTRGDVRIALHGMWQPLTEEVEIADGVRLRTGDGEATILLHDDGTIRIAPRTTVTLHDVSDRPAPGPGGPTLTLAEGTIWLQGLLPGHLRGIEVAAPGGSVVVHRSSVSLQTTADPSTAVRAWDRSVAVFGAQESQSVLAGEQVTLSEGAALPAPRRMESAAYEDPWVMQNLSRDAVHQREVAQMQKERRAARAGILPGTPLYPVKRAAERMDVLLTFDTQSRTQKKIDYAATRLNEAAALLAEGASGALLPLAEYRETLLALASGTGENLTQVLLSNELEEASAGLSAALPTDELYALKRIVLETSAQLAAGDIRAQDVEAMLLLDSLHGLRTAIRDENEAAMRQSFDALQPSLALLDRPAAEGGLAESVRKEIIALLTETATSLQQKQRPGDPATETGTLRVAINQELAPFLPPPPPPRPPVPRVTPEEIDAELSGILTRLDIYDLPRSRFNQLQYELARIRGHAAEGSILRRLYRSLEPALARHVLPAIEDLRTRLDR